VPLRRLLGLALCALVLYGVTPAVVGVLDAWPTARRIEPWWWAGMAVLQAGSLVCLWQLQRLCLQTRRFAPLVTAGLASGAVGRVVPGGAAVQAATQYGMLTRAGIPGATAGTGLAAAALLQFAALCAFPVLALPSILLGLDVADRLLTAAGAALGLFVAMFLVAFALLRWDGLLARAVAVAHWVTERLPSVALPDDTAARAFARRDALARALGRRWPEAVAAGVGRWALDLMCLVAALAAVGAQPRLALVLLAFVVAQVLAQLPITPGGVGVVEAGMTTFLVLAGTTGGQAAVATLAYRLVSYWLLLPAGLVGWILHRRRYGNGATEVTAAGAAHS
jgi:uncharacterized protein (TIRG00374 family)